MLGSSSLAFSLTQQVIDAIGHVRVEQNGLPISDTSTPDDAEAHKEARLSLLVNVGGKHPDAAKKKSTRS